MTSSGSVAASLSPSARKDLAVQMLSKTSPISHLAIRENVSRKFLHRQKRTADEAFTEAFAPATKSQDVLFHLPVTEAWLTQLTLALILISHSSYRGVVELMRDLLGVVITVATIHNWLQAAADSASAINRSQDLSLVRVGLHDEIYQGCQPVLAGIDEKSTYCYLLAGVDHRDGDTWGTHLLDAMQQGLDPDYTIADAGAGLRAGQKAAWGDKPCHGDVFHLQHQCEGLANLLSRLAKGATSRRKKLEQQMVQAKQRGQGNTLSTKLALARQTEQQAVRLARDVRTLVHWLGHDVLALAGPALEERQALFDFIVAELDALETMDCKRIRPVRIALENQRDDLLAFAKVLDEKLDDIAQRFDTPLYLIRALCLLQRKKPTSNAYWQRRNQLHAQLSGKFHLLLEAVTEAMKQTPRTSSLVENLNSRLRNYFFLRRQLGESYLGLLQFFLNHRAFLRSRRPERVGKSPRELMTGQGHPHWLELLGFTRFQQA